MSKFDNVSDKTKVWRAMEAKGVSRIDAHFSGGNDEGGVTNYTIYDTEGKAFLDQPPPEGVMGPARDIYPFTHEEFYGHSDYWPKEGSLAAILERPVDSEYGSWAGDFSAHGTCVWDLKTRKVTMQGEESTYQPFNKHF